MEFNKICTFYILISLIPFIVQVSADTTKNPEKRSVRFHNHHHGPSTRAPVIVPVTQKDKDAMHGLFPDIRPCYDGIPRIYERFAKERLTKRLKTCSEIEPVS